MTSCALSSLLMLCLCALPMGCSDPIEPLPDGDPELLLEYSFGNQITGSEITIKRDGSLVHTERTCCPPVITPQTEPSLTATALADLVSRIENVSQGSIQKLPYSNAEGGLYGQLHVHTAAIKKVEVRLYTFGEERRNQSPDATALISLANQYARVDMP